MKEKKREANVHVMQTMKRVEQMKSMKMASDGDELGKNVC